MSRQIPGRVKQALLSHMRHELRTPINAIIGYSELLLEEAEQRGILNLASDLEKVRSEGTRLLEQVNALLQPPEADLAAFDLETFGAQVRHQLRTPLTDVIGYSELLLEDAQDFGYEGVVADLNRIRDAGQNLLSRIEDILAFSRWEPGQAGVEEELSSAAALVEEVVQAVPALDKSGVEIKKRERGLVLVVDDNEINRDILSRRLAKSGHQAVLAANGREALVCLQQSKFDLILLDMVMPEMNGYQVLEQLKAHPSWSEISVIMISALDEIDSAVRCIQLGAEDYLTKPFNPILLDARVGACLEKKFLRDREIEYLRQIEEEQRRTEALLHVIFPAPIVQELKATNRVQPRWRHRVAVIFADIVGFTAYCESHPADEVVSGLQQLAERFEELTLRHSLQKIKTIGDAFMAAAGLLEPLDNPALSSVKCGLEMVAACETFRERWTVRVGIHLGSVVAGVVGHRQYLFDLWGDTVNTAAYVESHGIPGAVIVTDAVWSEISNDCQGIPLGPLPLKGRGKVSLFRVDRVLSPPVTECSVQAEMMDAENYPGLGASDLSQ